MATPKRVKREERDYADIYQENFVRNNDPAALGQAAFTRRLSSGIQRNMGQERLAANTAMPPVVPGLSGAGGQAQATGMQQAIIEQDALIAKERREDELRRGVSATQRAGYSPNDNAAMAMERRAGAMARAQQPEAGLSGVPRSMPSLENIGYSQAALARASQGEVGLTDPNFRTQLGDAANDPNIDYRIAAQRRAEQGEVGLTDPTGPSIESQFRVRQVTPAQRRAEQGEVGLTDGVLPSLERMRGIMPSELGTPTIPSQPDTAYADSREARRRAAEARAALGDGIGLGELPGTAATELTPGMTGIMPEEMTGIDADAQEEAKAREAELYGNVSATQLAGYSPVDRTPVDEPEDKPDDDDDEDDDGNKITLGGASASYDAGIRDEETRLNEQLDAEVNAVLANYNQRYNQFMQLAINRGAVRGNLEQQGFTGGIGQQVQDYLSTQEMVALDALMRERDQALQAIELERGNIPEIAKTNYIQSLQLESATSEARLAFSQQLSQRVLDGSMSLSEANGLAQEYGLQDVQSVFQTAIEAQIAAGTMDKAGAKAELERLGLDTSFLDEKKTYEDWQMSTEATQLENRMMAVLNNVPDSDWGAKVATVAAGVAAGTVFPGPGWIIGGVAGLYAAFEQDVNKGDMSKVTSSLMATDLMMNEGAEVWNGDFSSLEIKKPAGQATANAAQQEYLITIDGTQYSMEGADIMALAVALKSGSYSKTQYKALFDTAKTIFNNMPKDPGGAFDSITGGRYSTIKKIYDRTF